MAAVRCAIAWLFSITRHTGSASVTCSGFAGVLLANTVVLSRHNAEVNKTVFKNEVIALPCASGFKFYRPDKTCTDGCCAFGWHTEAAAMHNPFYLWSQFRVWVFEYIQQCQLALFINQ